MAKYIKTEEGYKELEKSISTVTDPVITKLSTDKMDKTNPVGTGSFSMNRKADSVVGTNSHAEGYNTTASGSGAHAEGGGTIASGSSSHAEGSSTKASGKSSHAGGFGTTASGDYSHAEGSYTIASGSNSHAEGGDTIASENSSHAEGNNTTASRYASHAEGDYTTASGECSHAEGSSTTASGECSHAEGSSTTASGKGSHAEGNSTNKFSLVGPTNPTTDGIINAWKSRKFSVAKGNYSHVEGMNNLALGHYSHAEGYNTIASGASCHTEGEHTTSSGDYSHAEGGVTTSSGDYSHAEGGVTTASGNYSHTEGSYTIAKGEYSHAEGYNTTASGENSHTQGKYNIEDTSNTYADIIGNGTSTKSSNAATVDWNGNAWYAGDVYTGSTSGTNRDEGSKKLATEEYADSLVPEALPNPNALTFTGAVNATYDGSQAISVEIPSGGTDISLGLTSAAVGQTIKVKAVDESGKPTEWETMDLPSGGGGGGDVFEKIVDITLAEDVAEVNITQDADGNTFSLKKVYICFVPAYGSDKTTSSAVKITSEAWSFGFALNSTRTISVLLYIDEVYAIGSTHYDATTHVFDTYAIKTQLLSRINEGQPISNLKLYYPNQTYYAGTKITVYGVRA